MVYFSVVSLAILTTSLLATLANGLAITYCSTENTAGGQATYSQYMSNGLCQTTCADYAYAVLQGGDCYCSNYAPSSQVDTLNCNEQCPGYPYDWCGSESAGLFGYYQLSVAPSGTAGASTSSTHTTSSVSLTSSTAATSSLSSSPTFTASSSSSMGVPTPDAPPDSSTSTTSTFVAPATTSVRSQTSTSDPPATTEQPTAAYTSIMTVTGQVKTIVVTPTSTSSPSSLGQGATSSGGVSTGKVVGIVLGVALGLGLIIGLGVWFWLRRKHRNESRASSQTGTYGPEDGNVSRTTPSRQVSQMSSSGLLGKAPRILTAGYGPSNSNGVGTNSRSPETASSNGIDRRSLGTDQRLNPYALYAHEEARLSSVSLQDNQDYSRQLRIANPD